MEKAENPTPRKLTLKNKIGFSAYQISLITDLMITGWQMYFFTTFIGMPIMTVTMLLTIGKILGAVVTPIYGYISDHLYQTRFGRKFGRRKGMLIIGAPIKIISFLLMWIPGLPTFVYFIIFLIPQLVTPMLTTIQLTFMSEMTQDSKQRAQLVGSNQVGGAIAGIFFSLSSAYLFKILGEHAARTFIIMAVIYDIICMICLIIFYNSVYELPVDESTVLNKGKQSSIKVLRDIFWDFLSVARLKSYGLYLGMYLCEQMFRSLRGTINTYFIIFVMLLNPSTVSLSTGAGFVCGLIFLAFFMWLTGKTNGPFSYRVGAYGTIIVEIYIMFLAFTRPSHLDIWFIVAIVALNFGITGVVNSTQFIFTLIPDVDEMVTAKRREGQYSGVNNTLDVIFTTVETLVIGIVLSATGFKEKASVQNPSTVKWLLILYTVVPIVCCLLGIIISHFCKLTVPKHAIIVNEIKRLRNGGKMEDVTPETKKTVEELTGFKYENCWGNNSMIDIANRHKKIDSQQE